MDGKKIILTLHKRVRNS